MMENSEHDLSVRLDNIDSMLNKINSKRKKTGIIYAIGIIIVVVVLVVFILNIFAFVKNYDTKATAIYLQKDLADVASSHQAKELVNAVQNKLLPDYQSALYVQFTESLPLFKSDLLNYQANIYAYLEDVIKPKLEKNLVQQLSDSEEAGLANILTNGKYADRMTNVLSLSNKMILDDVPSLVNDRIDPFMDQLSLLNGSFRAVYQSVADTGEFNDAAPGAWDVQAKLLQNVLQLAIYQINPQEGLEKAK